MVFHGFSFGFFLRFFHLGFFVIVCLGFVVLLLLFGFSFGFLVRV